MSHDNRSVTLVMAMVCHRMMVVSVMMITMMAVSAAEIVVASVMAMMFAIFLPVMGLVMILPVIICAVSFVAVMLTPPLRIYVTCHTDDDERNHQRKKSGCCFHFICG